ncbi:hypothetical protein HLK59_49735 [Streptomyces sp. S3(2020)]|uniref:hypothetical protein n=1 Tax=Streptomyces sp. S3(2020) TaxID=2732044 RepID=UPI0014894FD3|nr:hypothetical protein [Streptomyces sp. S3(2020)]NNN38247.1 hypothetical protein [Streptomyces sp. S3(2020)]
MSLLWTAVLPAITAGVFGIGGALIGVVVGRRQVTDQAVVEHGQWLRGQRQEAYLALLDAWDTALAHLEAIFDEWLERADWERQHPDLTWEAYVESQTLAAQGPLTKPLDRVQLLGPDPVDRATEAMDSAIGAFAACLNHQAAPDEPFDQSWSSWLGLETRAREARRSFTQAAKITLQTPPRPGRRERQAAEPAP